jgi:uncharacterized protein YecT (DUF1311 family)
MRLTIQLSLTVLCLTMTFPSLAGCDRCTKEYRSCIENAGGVTSEIQTCQSKEEETQEARLNTSYQRALKKLTPERKKELREVQKRWLTYRDAAARFYVDTGLSGYKISSSDQRLHLTAERVKELDGIDY